MKVLLSIFSLFLVSAPSFCFGASKIDSLLRVLHAKNVQDTGMVNILARLASSYKDINPDSAIYYAGRGQQLAVNINFERGEADCEQVLGLINLRRSNYDSALAYYKTALSVYKKTKDLKKESQVLRSVADVYYRKARYDSAMLCYKEAIQISAEAKDLAAMGIAYINIASIYHDQSNYIESINYYLEGLKVFERAKANEDVSNTMVCIATVYSTIGNFKKAEEYIIKSEAVPITNREILFTNYVNSGYVYAEMKKYDKAVPLFNKALLMADSLGDLSWKNDCIVNIAEIFYKTGQYDTAYALYKEVIKRNEDIKDTVVLVNAKSAMGSILIKRGKLNAGIKELEEAFQLSMYRGQKQTIFEASGYLSEAYEQQHNYSKALYYQKMHYNYSDSLHNERTDKRISQMQFDYELGKKEDQIALLNKDKEIQADKNEEQRTIMWALLTGLALLAIICILLYRYSVREKRNSSKILLQKEEIEKQAIKLEELNRFKDKTFSVLSHDLRGPLGSVTATVELLDQNQLSAEEFSQMKPEVNRQLKSLNILLDNLLQWAKNYIQGQTHAQPSKINLREATDYAVELLNDAATLKEIKITNNIPGSINVWFDPEQLQIVSRNIIMNALKFTPHGGIVSLDARTVNDTVHLSITDSGIGMTKEQVDKLFTPATENTSYGTDGEKGTGLGLLLSYEFIKANRGDISVNSQPGKGTSFDIEMPASK